MKKLFILILSITLCINLTACFNSSNKNISTKANNNNVLTIATFEENSLLEEAVQKFNASNPNIKVEIKVYGNVINNVVDLGDGRTYSSAEITPEEIQKYRSTINTELMSGSAPDIIDLSNLPYKNYIDSGMIANMYELMKNDNEFNINNYNTKVFETYQYKDGLYVIPLDYILSLITSNYYLDIDDSTWDWQDFFSAAQEALNKDTQNIDTEYIFTVTVDRFFEEIFQNEYKNYVNEEEKTANFTSKEFVDIMKYCKSLADDKIICKTSEDCKKSKFIFERYGMNSLYDTVADGVCSYVIDNATRYYYKTPSNNGKNGVMINAFNKYAINNSSNNKNLAWKFIKFMLSDEMQTSPKLYLFPVNNTAFNKKLERDSKQLIDECKEFNQISIEKNNELLENYTSRLKEFISSITTCRDANPEILEIVNEYVQMYFSEEKTAEQAAQIIQNKVSIYLNEQR